MKKKLLILIICSVEIFSFIYLITLKYKQQNLELNEFIFSFWGNIVNIFFSSAIILSFLILLFLERIKDTFRLQFILVLILFGLLNLVFADFFYVLKLDDFFNSVFGNYSDKVFVSIFFIFYQYTQTLILFSVLIILTNKSKRPFLAGNMFSLFFYLLLTISVFLLTFSVKGEIDINKFKSKKADAAVVMGAAVWNNNRPSDALMGRIIQAKKIWDMGLTNRIVMTGGNAPGENSEGKIAKRTIVRMGVPPQNVFIEEKTKSTNEQVFFIRSILKYNNKIKDIIVVSDNYHLFRIKTISEFYGINLNFSSTVKNISLGNEIWFRFRETISIILFSLFGI